MSRVTTKSIGEIDALILAGGMGTRLKSVLPDLQKVVAPVSGQPFLLKLITAFQGVRIRRIILALGHRADGVLEAIDGLVPPEITIIPSIEAEPLGTAGALRHALPLIKSDIVLVTNGDSFVNADLSALLAFHVASRARITMALSEVPDVGRYGAVCVDAAGCVTDFREKRVDVTGPGMINAGVYLIEREVIANLPAGNISLEKDVFPKYCGRGLYGMKSGNSFIDIGTPDDYSRAGVFFAT
jgi:D-glycero-alpha-D-manno-heptose 1-phosphate guanylyltransferase